MTVRNRNPGPERGRYRTVPALGGLALGRAARGILATVGAVALAWWAPDPASAQSASGTTAGPGPMVRRFAPPQPYRDVEPAPAPGAARPAANGGAYDNGYAYGNGNANGGAPSLVLETDMGIAPSDPGPSAAAGRDMGGLIPRVPGPERSGIVTRYIPREPWMPPDRKRDVFFGTRYDQDHGRPSYDIRNPKRGGLYGQMLTPGCATCYSPYFTGKPGVPRSGPACEPSHPLFRFPNSLLSPLKPVNYYYAGGCWTPVYDLDPWTIGPGTFPYPRVFDHIKGG